MCALHLTLSYKEASKQERKKKREKKTHTHEGILPIDVNDDHNNQKDRNHMNMNLICVKYSPLFSYSPDVTGFLSFFLSSVLSRWPASYCSLITAKLDLNLFPPCFTQGTWPPLFCEPIHPWSFTWRIPLSLHSAMEIGIIQKSIVLIMGASGTGTSGQADTVEEVGLDRTHPQEASIQHHTPSSDLEPAEEEEERPASQQLEARHWSRAETAGDQLVRNDKSSPEQSAMAGGHWWPMLHWERRA